MEINNTSKINFSAKIPTVKVFETTCLKLIESNDISELKSVLNTFGVMGERKSPGHQGYRHYLKQISDKILEKYPDIKEATNKINLLIKNNPYIKRTDLQSEIKPILEKFGEEIDIII